ncbi:hypothetical protein [Streptomyces platensis]
MSLTTTPGSGLRLLCECGNEVLWFMLVVTEDGAEARCGQCEAAVVGRPDASIGPAGRTIKAEAVPPQKLSPWETTVQDLKAAFEESSAPNEMTC